MVLCNIYKYHLDITVRPLCSCCSRRGFKNIITERRCGFLLLTGEHLSQSNTELSEPDDVDHGVYTRVQRREEDDGRVEGTPDVGRRQDTDGVEQEAYLAGSPGEDVDKDDDQHELEDAVTGFDVERHGHLAPETNRTSLQGTNNCHLGDQHHAAREQETETEHEVAIDCFPGWRYKADCASVIDRIDDDCCSDEDDVDGYRSDPDEGDDDTKDLFLDHELIEAQRVGDG